MKRFLKILLAFVVLVLLSVVTLVLVARHKKLKVTKNTNETVYEPEITKFNFPLLISMNDIEKLANRKIKRVLVDSRFSMKNQNDTLILKITRLGDIDIKLRNGCFQSSVPLKVEVQIIKRLIGKKKVLLFKEKPLKFLIDASLESSFGVTQNMKLKTKSRLKEVIWVEEPNLKLFGFDINLKEKINGLLEEKSAEITHKLDSLMSKKINIKKQTVKIWNKIQYSIKATKKQKDLFVRVQPRALGVYVDKSLGDTLKLDLIVDAKVYLRFGEDTATIQKVKFPKTITLISKKETTASSKIHVHCLFPLKKLNEIAKRELQGKRFNAKGLDLLIKKVEIFSGKKTIYVKVKHGGTVRGTLLMRGFPEFSFDDQQIAIRKVSFENKLDDQILGSVTDLLHEQMTSLVKQYTTIDVRELLESIPELSDKALSKSKLSKKADIGLMEIVVEDLEVKLGKDNIQLLISGSGDFDISLKKESFRGFTPK